MAKDKSPHVAVLVDTSTGWGRRLIRGVIRYSDKHGPWHEWHCRIAFCAQVEIGMAECCS